MSTDEDRWRLDNREGTRYCEVVNEMCSSDRQRSDMNKIVRHVYCRGVIHVFRCVIRHALADKDEVKEGGRAGGGTASWRGSEYLI